MIANPTWEYTTQDAMEANHGVTPLAWRPAMNRTAALGSGSGSQDGDPDLQDPELRAVVDSQYYLPEGLLGINPDADSLVAATVLASGEATLVACEAAGEAMRDGRRRQRRRKTSATYPSAAPSLAAAAAAAAATAAAVGPTASAAAVTMAAAAPPPLPGVSRMAPGLLPPVGMPPAPAIGSTAGSGVTTVAAVAAATTAMAAAAAAVAASTAGGGASAPSAALSADRGAPPASLPPGSIAALASLGGLLPLAPPLLGTVPPPWPAGASPPITGSNEVGFQASQSLAPKWHSSALTAGSLSEDGHVFAKTHAGPQKNHSNGMKLSSLCMLFERTLRVGGVHRYRYTILGGSVGAADGVGFVFDSRIRRTNIQKMRSIFLNKHGQVCIRNLDRITKLPCSLPKLSEGVSIFLTVDLDKSAACFRMDDPCGQPCGTADFSFASLLGDPHAAPQRLAGTPPSGPSSPHLAPSMPADFLDAAAAYSGNASNARSG
eukprot:CAMPEP_0115195068 /NCGR_PEP_ID=MMETSP0270-20121206/14391_1 /TAXON_ID=71861 /ORGANISM="Scrippsiella trochoidea, Strain CCMP3099" /LENGTH=490 /DNA_ID=CAMNT_0002608381 /DNA_START=43 /DNA_END=1512 /DNA_ORIENTATION=-